MSDEKAAPTRVVVCAANRAKSTGEIALGARHYDALMRQAIQNNEAFCGAPVEQGFIDQWGVFMDRKEAHAVALAAGQIKYRCGGDDGKLFSENLY